MARKKTFNSAAKWPMNQWVRDAFDYAAEQGNDITYTAMADFLTAARIGQTYDKTMMQKMTKDRKVVLAEAQVISRITGFPLPASHPAVVNLDERVAKLSEVRRKRLLEVLADFEAAEASHRQGE